MTLEWYDAAHEALARGGARVLALAYKRLPDDEADGCDGDDDDANDKNGSAEKDAAGARRRARPPRPRREVEDSLTFVGFAAFRSHARSDSAATVRALHGEGHLRVAMVTGDATPTALSAAREVRRRESEPSIVGIILDCTSSIRTASEIVPHSLIDLRCCIPHQESRTDHTHAHTARRAGRAPRLSSP